MACRNRDHAGRQIDPDQLYPVAAAARLLGLSASAFRDLERSGRLTCERTAGRHRRVAGSELLRFLEAGAQDQPQEPTLAPAPPVSAADRAARQAWLARWISEGLGALPAESPAAVRLRLRTDIERALRGYDPEVPDPEVSALVQTLADHAREQMEAEQERVDRAANKAALIEYGQETLAKALHHLPSRLVGAPKTPTRRHLQARLRDELRGYLGSRLTGEELVFDVDELVRDFEASWQVEHTPPSRVPPAVKAVATGLVGAVGGAAAVTLSVPSIRATVKERMTALATDLSQRLRTAINNTPPASSGRPGSSPGTGAR
jgi:excisionase family DNA binding protein